MRKIVHNLRKLPEKDRHHILNLSIVVVSVALFGLWTLTLRQNLTTAENKAKFNRDLEPFRVLSNNLTAGYNILQNTEKNSKE